MGVQLKYESALPDAFPMPKREYLFPEVDTATWDQMVKAYVEALEGLKDQVLKEEKIPKKQEPPWMRKNSSSGLFETVWSEKDLVQ